MKSRETTAVLQMTSMPVLVTLALLLLLVVGSIVVTTTRTADDRAGTETGSGVVWVESKSSSAVLDLGPGSVGYNAA